MARLENTCWEPSALRSLNIESWSKRGQKGVTKRSPRGHQIVQVGNIVYYFLDDNAHSKSGEHVRRPICSQYGFRLLLFSPALPPLPFHRYNTSTASIRGQCKMCIGVFILIVNCNAIIKLYNVHPLCTDTMLYRCIAALILIAILRAIVMQW